VKEAAEDGGGPAGVVDGFGASGLFVKPFGKFAKIFVDR